MNSRLTFDVFNAPLVGSNLIEASAGTGKTWSITGLYLRLVVEKELLPENILVVTFTKAATAELTGRIRKRLHEAMSWINGQQTTEDEEFFSALFKQWQGSISEAQIKQRLLIALARFDQAAIFTIHSFCQRLLNDYAFEAGARFNLTPVTDTSEQLSDVVQDFWRNQMLTLTEEDKEWVEWLVKKKQTPAAWLKAVDKFKSKPYQKILEPQKVVEQADFAAAKDELADLFPELSSKLKNCQEEQLRCKTYWDNNYEAVISCLRQSIADGNLLAKDYKLDKFDSYIKSVKEVLVVELSKSNSKHGTDAKKFCQSEIDKKVKVRRNPPKHKFFLLMNAFLSTFEAYKEVRENQNKLIAILDKAFQYRLQVALKGLLLDIDKKFPALKSCLGMMDFDDMILSIYQALVSDSGRVLAIAVAKQFRAALVDEFQDTDPLQLTIFQSLFAQTQTPLFYVGDPKQAIYSFRGADIYAYYQGSDASDYQRTLKTNFRSTPALVDSVNALFSPSHRSFISEEITFDWVAAKPKKELYIEGQPPEAMQFVIAESKDQKAFSKGEIEPIAISHTVQQIADILAKADTGYAYFTSEDGQKSKVNPADIAILVPTHKQAALMAEALSKQGVMSVRQGQDKVLESDAAKTVLRLMRAVADPGVEARVTELLADPLLGLAGHEIVAMKDGGPQWESLLEDYWQLKRIWTDSGFSAMFRHWLSLPDSNGTTLAQRLVDYHDGERNLTDLMHIAEIMQQRSRQQSSIKALVSWLQYAFTGNSNEDEHQLRLESDTQRVKIVTLHAAKGLEYNIVFCPFLWQGKQGIKDEIIGAHQDTQAVVDFGSDYFAEAKKQANEDQLKEQLRLLYVALTRPVHRCVIFWAHVQAGGYKFTANSALAWLLYGDDSMQDNPVEKLRGKVTKMSFAEFVAGVNDFQTQAEKRQPASITGNMAAVSCLIVQESAAAKRVKLTPEAERKLSCAAVLDRYLAPSWLQTSFSGLVGNQHASVERSAHADDVPEEGTTDEGILKQNNTTEGASQPPSIFNFPRGALPGECLHSIFEHWDFTSTDKAQLKGLIADKMNRFAICTEGQREKWYEPVAQAVFGTLQKPLNERGFCLARIDEADRQAELEFMLTARGTVGHIHSILANPLYQLPSAFVDASKQLNDKKIQGFLTGFIDLVFKDDQDKYHVLDWKSNYLGDQTKDYAPRHMEHAMAKTHYYLQALLYLLALHRYLRQQLPHYNIEQHLGGAWYVFVRGIDIDQSSAEPASGLYYFQPPAALILALDEQLATQEVVV